MRMIKLTCLLALLLALSCAVGTAQHKSRTEVAIPDLPGYVTLKCDFHMHTVFSDGNVWPAVRVQEAWREGLDVIATTDHVESQAHDKDISTDLNRPYEINKSVSASLDIIPIRAGEITRRMPPGHFNALFLADVNALKKDEWRDAMKEAIDQGAFLFWNHPGWKGQQADGIAKWYEEHTEIFTNGWLHGVEVVNYNEYYPEVHRWCIEKNLTLMGNSDVHDPIHMTYDLQSTQHRPLTLVFAKDRTAEAVKEALFDHRTAVYFNNQLIGAQKHLGPLFHASIQIKNKDLVLKGKNKAYLQITNNSDLDFELEGNGKVEGLSFTGSITLYAHKTSVVTLRSTTDSFAGDPEVRLPYRVKNLLVAPEEGAVVELSLHVTTAE
jgi:hypothetical protein